MTNENQPAPTSEDIDIDLEDIPKYVESLLEKIEQLEAENKKFKEQEPFNKLAMKSAQAAWHKLDEKNQKLKEKLRPLARIADLIYAAKHVNELGYTNNCTDILNEAIALLSSKESEND